MERRYLNYGSSLNCVSFYTLLVNISLFRFWCVFRGGVFRVQYLGWAAVGVSIKINYTKLKKK